MVKLIPISIALFAVTGALYVAIHNGFVSFVLAVLIVFGGPLLYARLTGRARRTSGDLYWRGYVSFYEGPLNRREMFPHIHKKRSTGGIGRQGLSSGKLEIRRSGMHWVSGGWITPQTRIAGYFDLAWSGIENAQISSLSGKLPGLGGALSFDSMDGGVHVEGQFIGSRRGLERAIRDARDNEDTAAPNY